LHPVNSGAVPVKKIGARDSATENNLTPNPLSTLWRGGEGIVKG